jgi:hypothetical protein
MRPVPTILAAVSAMSILSACSGETTPENTAASGVVNDQGMVEMNASGPASPPLQETEAADVGEQTPRSEAPRAQPQAPETAPRRPVRTPLPKAPRPAPTPDPHAGHNMNNMSN